MACRSRTTRRNRRGLAGRCGVHELLAVQSDATDAKHGDVLAMAIPAAAVLPAALLENDDLVQPVLRDDGRGDRGAGDGRRANRQVAAVAYGKHVRKGDG